jgi:hypothetical protein
MGPAAIAYPNKKTRRAAGRLNTLGIINLARYCGAKECNNSKVIFDHTKSFYQGNWVCQEWAFSVE